MRQRTKCAVQGYSMVTAVSLGCHGDSPLSVSRSPQDQHCHSQRGQLGE